MYQCFEFWAHWIDSKMGSRLLKWKRLNIAVLFALLIYRFHCCVWRPNTFKFYASVIKTTSLLLTGTLTTNSYYTKKSSPSVGQTTKHCTQCGLALSVCSAVLRPVGCCAGLAAARHGPVHTQYKDSEFEPAIVFVFTSPTSSLSAAAPAHPHPTDLQHASTRPFKFKRSFLGTDVYYGARQKRC